VAGSDRDVASLEKALADSAARPFEARLAEVLGEVAARSAIRVDPVARSLVPGAGADPVVPGE
jgi:hypothetical protein